MPATPRCARHPAPSSRRPGLVGLVRKPLSSHRRRAQPPDERAKEHLLRHRLSRCGECLANPTRPATQPHVPWRPLKGGAACHSPFLTVLTTGPGRRKLLSAPDRNLSLIHTPFACLPGSPNLRRLRSRSRPAIQHARRRPGAGASSARPHHPIGSRQHSTLRCGMPLKEDLKGRAERVALRCRKSWQNARKRSE
jgi:hypothetical protein